VFQVAPHRRSHGRERKNDGHNSAEGVGEERS